MENKQFETPVALFIFKRSETVVRILERIRIIKPKRIYLIGDGPRNEEESSTVNEARKIIEKQIDLPCAIIKNYADRNRGVYENIAGGAKWVFSQEPKAIFLEDDNLPDISFFEYCEELLSRYENSERVLWICGTNYLEKYNTKNDESYVFTQHLLPCGWASWATKFTKYYDGDLNCLDNDNAIAKLIHTYKSKPLFRQQLNSANYELHRRENGQKYASWDFQMAISIRYNNLIGISPKHNLIENIGVDGLSTHGGNSFENEMTRRFCAIKSYPLQFPLKHPETICVDPVYEAKVDKIILAPWKMRMKDWIATRIKHLFGLSKYDKFTLKNIKEKKYD